MNFEWKNAETELSCSHEPPTFLEYHMPLIIKKIIHCNFDQLFFSLILISAS